MTHALDDLLSAEAAQARILAHLAALGPEWVPLGDALGRTLAGPVLATRTQPPWDNSAMDGFAVRAVDVQQPVRLPVIDVVYAGQRPTRSLEPRTAIRIMTGAPLPEGATAVVMQERTRMHAGPGLGEVEVLEPVEERTNVRDAGEDARAGALLLEAGTPLGIPECALLAGQGLMQAQVPRRPRVAILATGDELCRPDEPPAGRIVDTNSLALALAVRRAGGLPTALGIARDDPDAVHALLAEAVRFDVVLTSAGVSVGERDFVRGALDRLGVQMDFWGVAIRPGKPVAFGRRDSTLFFGLPGNPTSSAVTFELFVRPALRRLLGHAAPLPVPVAARSAVPLRKKPGLAHFLRVTASFRDGSLWAEPLASQTSGAVRSGASATHLLHLPMETISVDAGDVVECLPVSWGP